MKKPIQDQSQSLNDIIKAIGHPIAANFSEIQPVECPCGHARRGLVEPANQLCSVHVVDISSNAQTHYHKDHIEVYYALQGSGEIEIDGQRRPLTPGNAILIPTGARHRAVVQPNQTLQILNIVIPPFDPEDEHFD